MVAQKSCKTGLHRFESRGGQLFSSIIDWRHHKCTIPQFSLNSFVNHAFKILTIHASHVCLGQFSQFSQHGELGFINIMKFPPYILMSVYEVVQYLFLRIKL